MSRDGHVSAFAFFGGVPLSILYDNTTLAVAKILGDGTRQRTRIFSELQSHYLFEDRFGRPGKGNDKGNVEGVIGFGRRNFLVPMPRFESFEALNDETLSAIDGVDGPACGIAMCQGGNCIAFHRAEPSMDQPITIGLDLAKSVFQLHGVDAEGRAVVRRQLRRSQLLGFFERLGPCLVGMEACSGAHHWARELGALGHEVRLMPPAYVKPYIKRGKTDGETGPWPQMRPRKPVERCRGDLRGSHATEFKPVRASGSNDPGDRSKAQNALRAGEVGRASGGAAGPQGTGLPREATDPDGERDPRASIRVRHRRGQGHP